MTEEEKPTYSKGSSVDLRVILIGDVGVGKKSIVQRLKLVNSTETRNNNFQGFFFQKKKKSTIKKEKNKKKEENLAKSKRETTTNQSIGATEEENEEDKLRERREEKRINCMTFSKIYSLGFNSIEISYYPCAEEEPLSYDYELKDDDEFYDFEKEYKVSIKKIIKELEAIILKPSDDPKSQIEILFMLCFDLGNLPTFEKLVIHFSQINRHFKINGDYKIILVGNKLDKRQAMTSEEKENLERFKSKFKLNYYEISSLMFFNFDIFFEKFILDNFGNLPLFNQYKDKFHEIINTKKSFSKTKRPQFGGDDNPPANKYDNNPFKYPDNEKEFKKMFQDRDKYNKHIFINKRSVLYPPIRNNDKDILIENSKKKSFSTDKKVTLISWDSAKREEIKAALELQNNKPGYSFGLKTYKPLGLFKDREKLRKIREKEKKDALGGNIVLMDEKRTLTEGNIEETQRRYEKNRNNYRDIILEERKLRNDDLKERHDEVNEKNLLSYNEKIMTVNDKQEKYSKIFEEKEKNKEKIRNDNYLKNNSKIFTGYQEPKCRFYDPVPSISTNKGFTFGKKYDFKDKEIYSPDYATFIDDFEKLIEKNRKRKIIKPTQPKIVENKSIDTADNKLIEKMKLFEERRLNHKKHIFNDFFEDRKYKKDNVIQKKIEIKTKQDQNLQEQIQKTYKDDKNYLIRDINYGQVESTSPSFSIKGKYEIGSIFQVDKHDKETEFSTPNKKANKLEYPNFSIIRPRYPAFSFGTSQRFNSISIDGRNSRIRNNIKNNRIKRYETEGNEYIRDNNIGYGSLYYYGSQDYQSFLKMQTTMGTGKKLINKDNGFPGPNQYTIRGFADDVKLKGDKVNETRIMLKEKKKLEDLEKKRMAKLREERFEERKKALKLSLKEIIGIDNENNDKTEQYSKERNLESKNEMDTENNKNNIPKNE